MVKLKFAQALREILSARPDGATPQEIRDVIQTEYPYLYGTEAHHRNVDKGHYKDLGHAVLAQIYVMSRQATDIYSDRATKPMTLSLFSSASVMNDDLEEESNLIDVENLSRLEDGVGIVYVLGTDLYTKNGDEIVKVGITTGSVEARIQQLYNTSVPTKFRVIKTYEVRNYSELEQSLHRLLDPYRINRAREFFTEHCVPYVDKVASLHIEIQSNISANNDQHS